MDQTLRTIHLYGELREKFGVDTVQLVGQNMQIISSGLDSMVPGTKEYIRDNKWQVCFNDHDESVSAEDVHLLDDHNATVIHLYPAVEGAGRTGQIILGIVLIVVGIIAAFPTGGATLQSVAYGAGLIMSGAMMVYTALTTPKAAQMRAAPEERASFLFNGPINVLEQGGAVPVVYGRILTGSTVVSAGITAEEVTFYNSPTGQTIAPNSAFGIEAQVLA